MKTKLEQYIKFKGISISRAAREIGVSRPLIHYALKGKPVGRRTALKIEEWSGGMVSAIELAGFKRQ